MPVRWLSIGGLRLQLVVLKPSHGFVGRPCQPCTEVQGRRHLELIASFSSMIQVPGSFLVFLKGGGVSIALGNPIAICLQLGHREEVEHGDPGEVVIVVGLVVVCVGLGGR